MVNRNPVKKWFITFSRWTYLEDIKSWEKILPPSVRGKIVMELHKELDDNKNRNSIIHYHVAVEFVKGWTTSKLVKYFEKKYPNDYKRVDIEIMGSWDGSTEYFKKEPIEIHNWNRVKLSKDMQKIHDVMFSDIAVAQRREYDEKSEARYNKTLFEIWRAEHAEFIEYLQNRDDTRPLGVGEPSAGRH